MKKLSKYYLSLTIISILAIILRLIVAGVLLQKDLQVLSPAMGSDPQTYMQFANQILKGEFTGVFYYQPFYYAVFLPVSMLIFGATVKGVIFSQALLGGATVFLVGLIGKEVYSKKSGVIASMLFAIANVPIFYTAYHKIATLQTFNVTLITLFLILFIKSKTVKKTILFAALSGLAIGVACATRGNLYLVLFGIIPLILIKGIKDKKIVFTLANILLIAGCIVVAQLPFIIHNSLELGRITGASNASGAVLALGNTPEAPAGGRNYFSGNGPMEYPESYHVFMENEKSKKRSVAMQIMDYAFEKPLEYIELSFRKVLLFWSYGEIPNNVSYYEGKRKVAFMQYNLLGESFVIMILGFGGLLSLLFLKKVNYPYFMLFLTVIFYQLSIAFFYNLGRFRVPILADMSVFAGIFLMQIYENRREFKKLRYNLLALFFAIYIVFFGYSCYQKGYEASVMSIIRPHGTTIKTLNENEFAIFDYGPRSFGDWEGFWIEKNSVSTKEFDVENPNQSGKIKFLLNAKGNIGTAVMKINGTVHTFDIANSDDGFFEVPVTLIDKKVNFELINFYNNPTTNQVDLATDKLRDYGRSSYNGEVIPFEWIMRFYYTKER